MTLFNIHETKTRLSKLLTDVEKHNEIIVICRNGQPITELKKVTHSLNNPLRQHPQLSKGKILYDPVQPLSKKEWPVE